MKGEETVAAAAVGGSCLHGEGLRFHSSLGGHNSSTYQGILWCSLVQIAPPGDYRKRGRAKAEVTSISYWFLAYNTFDTNSNLTSSFISFGEKPRQWRMEDIHFIRNTTFFPLSFFSSLKILGNWPIFSFPLNSATADLLQSRVVTFRFFTLCGSGGLFPSLKEMGCEHHCFQLLWCLELFWNSLSSLPC